METSAVGVDASERASLTGVVVSEPASPEHSEATRYLCAAAHLDRGLKGQPGTQLRQQVIDSLMVDEIHAIGTSPGLDLRQVVREVERAAQRKLIRDVALSVLLILAFVLGVLSTSLAVLLLFFVLACEVIHVEAWIATYSVVARRMLGGQFQPDHGSSAGGRLQHILDEIDAAQSGNVTVYSGFTPFVGVGYEHGGWSFSVNISEGAKTLGVPQTPKPFDLTELYSYVAADVEALGIPNVTLEDRLYADGRRVAEDKALLADRLRRPATSVSAAAVAAAVGEAGEHVRYYKVIRVVGWGGELVLSIFLRFIKVERSLFAEASYFLLPPLNEACHVVDRIQPVPSGRDNVRLFWESALATPLLWVRAPRAVVGSMMAPIRYEWQVARMRRQAAANPDFDYGATTSVRDEQKSTNYRQYFQQLDRDLYVKVVERQLLDSLFNFFDAHGIDTSEMRQRGSTILNNGVMMSGGVIQAENIAVGAGAQAKGGPQAPAASGAGSK